MRKFLRGAVKKCVATGVLVSTMFCSFHLCLADTYNESDYTKQSKRENYNYGSVTYSAYLGYSEHKCGGKLSTNLGTGEAVRVELKYDVQDLILDAVYEKNASERNYGSVTKTVDFKWGYIIDCEGRFFISNVNNPVWEDTLR